MVILGLIGVTLARFIPGLNWMSQADAIAAFAVALIVIYVSGELGYRTIQALLDTAPQGVTEQIISQVDQIDGVSNCHAVRILSLIHI